LENEPSEDDSGSLSPRATMPQSAVAAVAELGRRLLSVRAVIVAIEGDASSSVVAFDHEDWLVARASSASARALADPVTAGDLGLRFYVGIPLHGASGRNLGMLAAVDGEPRELSAEELGSLKLAACIVTELIEYGEIAESAPE
jgi:GAF domain-containing protein